MSDKLKCFHENINNYIQTKSWRCLSSNELVEVGVRCLSVGFDFNKASWNVKKIFSVGLLFLSIIPLFLVMVGFLFSYFIFKFWRRNKLDIKNMGLDEIFFIRNNLSKKRLNKLLGTNIDFRDTVLVYDDFVEFSLDEFSNKSVGLSGYLEFKPFDYIFTTMKEMLLIITDTVNNWPIFKFNNLVFSMTRVPHMVLVYLSLDNLAKKNNVSHIYSFEMISRFSSVLNAIVINNKIKYSTGFPHGLEYDIYYPRGYFGKTFYCTSVNAKSSLSAKYKGVEFIFNPEVISCLFRFNLSFKDKMLPVYYTDARNPSEDYLNISKMKSYLGFIKLHPADKKSRYVDLGVRFLDDFVEAISYGIVIMRASTVLFESQLSGCKVFCLNATDKEKYLLNYLYPTLKSLNLNLIENVDDFDLTQEENI